MRVLSYKCVWVPLIIDLRLSTKIQKLITTVYYSLFVDYRVQLESLPSVYGQLSHTLKSLKRL
jgi:hypothetical protein